MNPFQSLQYDDWRCITEEECKNMTYYVNDITINQERSYKIYMGSCLEHCP